MDKFEVPIQDLVLDLKNPRLVEADTQLEALQALIKLGPTYFRNLMRSIKENGLDPGDSFYVLEDPEEDGLFIVVDGNRRLAALTVLNEPSVLKGIELAEADLRLLAKAAEGYTPGTITDVDCVLFEERAQADEWIERRHGNDLAGEGRLVWGPLEIERFQRDHTNLDVIDFVGRNTTLPVSEWTTIKASVEKNSSLLNRLLSNKAFRRMVGLTVTTETDDSKLPYFSVSPDTVLGVMEKVFRDISEKRINSRSLNNAEEIEAYLDQLPTELKSDPRPDAVPQRFRDVSITKPEPAKTKAHPTSKPAKTTKAARPRQTLSESKHPFMQPETTKGQRLVFEASKLNANNFPLSSAYVLRAFLEHTIDGYMLDHSLPRQDGRDKPYELSRRAELVIEHLIKSGKANGTELRRARSALTDTKSPSSFQALNDYHHARYVIPSADTLRSTWDACIPLFQAVYGRPS